MNMKLNYITNAEGKKMSVVISYEEWLRFEEVYRKLSNKIAVLSSIKSGIEEVKEARRKGVELQSLEDFLNEC